MATLVTDKKRLSAMIGNNSHAPGADRLFRDGGVFFVGGALPVYETLETMFDSYCLEATALFYLTFGPRETFPRGEEMARQIKKNFHVRLMARPDQGADAADFKRIYAAGVDNVDLPLEQHVGGRPELSPALKAAAEIFPRWGVAATLQLDAETSAGAAACIDRLLGEGIVPLVRLSSRSASREVEAVLEHLVAGWERSSVPLSAYLPLIGVTTPLVATRPAGFFRGIVDRLRERQQLAGSDIRRHLRVQQAEDSLDSAGL